MNIEEKVEEVNNRIKLKCDSINYKISGIMSRYSRNETLRDGSLRDIINTTIIDPTLGDWFFVKTDADTLEMLYVQTGPTNFVEIDHFFKKYEDD